MQPEGASGLAGATIVTATAAAGVGNRDGGHPWGRGQVLAD
ncbi:hypothetical protein [Candidatus Synechococcus spongiarum]|nr:hypothetical protein [Candidatus Synechococcus spongiarum]